MHGEQNIKIVEKGQVSLKSDRSNGHFTCRPKYIYRHISLDTSDNDKLFRQREAVDNIKTHTSCTKTFSLKSCRLCGNVDRYCTDTQVTDDNIIWRMRFNPLNTELNPICQ